MKIEKAFAVEAKERMRKGGEKHSGNQYTQKMEGMAKLPELPTVTPSSATSSDKAAAVTGASPRGIQYAKMAH